MTAEVLQRVFKLGATEIVDANPTMSLDDAVRILAKQYPQFRHTRLYPEDGNVVDGKWVYDVPLMPAKTNG